ncbi:MAG: hypothetical protein P1U63_06695 [Coxiellaceae bacterium]|nr:hypothetical protein [Coxiellaceae bacterium]
MPLTRYIVRKPGSAWTYRHLIAPSMSVAKNPEGYTYKLRINLSEADYKAYKKQIITYLMDHDETSSLEKGLGVISSFKVLRKNCRTYMSKGDSFFGSGQFTLYLQYPHSHEDLDKFILPLQHFLTGLGVSRCKPMARDFSIRDTDNVSMRLERVSKAYICSTKIMRDRTLANSFVRLQADTDMYLRFHLGISISATKSDEIHALNRLGFSLIYARSPAIGQGIQLMAYTLRAMQASIQAVDAENIHSMLGNVNADCISLLGLLKHAGSGALPIIKKLERGICQVMGDQGKRYLELIKAQYDVLTRLKCRQCFSGIFSRGSRRPAVMLQANVLAQEALVTEYVDSLVGDQSRAAYSV